MLALALCILTNVLSLFLFLTANAEETSPYVEKQDTELIQLDLIRNESIPKSSLPKNKFYDISQSVSFHLGLAPDFRKLNHGEHNTPWFWGFDYTFKSSTMRHFELAADLYSNNKLYILGDYKFIFYQTEELRPYLRTGLSLRFDEGDHLETPFDLKSYGFVFGGGVEDIMHGYQSLRIGLDFYLGHKSFTALILLGYSWGF